MTDHDCPAAFALISLRAGIVDALGLRPEIGREMSGAALVAAVRHLRLGYERLAAADLATNGGGNNGQ